MLKLVFRGKRVVLKATERLMEYRREFSVSKALLISALAHLLLFAMVTVVVEPLVKSTFYPRVAFLGSILSRESVSPERLPSKEGEWVEGASYALWPKSARIKEIALFKIKRASPAKKFPMRPELTSRKSRRQPEYSGREVGFFRLRARKENRGTANISWGYPYQRDILYQPSLPEYHLWVDRTGGNFSLELEFLVSPQGRIARVKKLTSSGFSEIDAQVVRYLKKWQFVPSPAEQWGRVKLNFKLR